MRQQPHEGDHPSLGHPLQGPDDAAQQHVGEAGPHRQLHGIGGRGAHCAQEEAHAHATQSW